MNTDIRSRFRIESRFIRVDPWLPPRFEARSTHFRSEEPLVHDSGRTQAPLRWPLYSSRPAHRHRPIRRSRRVIIPTGPAGGSDMQGRLMCKRLTETTGQPFFADNRPGAGHVGESPLPKRPRTATRFSLPRHNRHLHGRLPEDGVRDAEGSRACRADRLRSPASDRAPQRFGVIGEAVRRARASASRKAQRWIEWHRLGDYIALEMLRQAAGIDVAHVPYKSGVASATALMSGEAGLDFYRRRPGAPAAPVAARATHCRHVAETVAPFPRRADARLDLSRLHIRKLGTACSRRQGRPRRSSPGSDSEYRQRDQDAGNPRLHHARKGER